MQYHSMHFCSNKLKNAWNGTASNQKWLWTLLRPVAIVVKSLSRVGLFVTPWTAAHQASLSFAISLSLLKLMSIESVMPSNHLILCSHLLPLSSFPTSGSFPMSQLFASGGQSIEVSASTSAPPMNTQDSPPLERTSWISLLSKGLSRVFSNTTVQKRQFISAQLSLLSNSHIHTWLLGNHSLD